MTLEMDRRGSKKLAGTLWKAALGLGAAVLVRRALRSPSDLAGKVVLITGGSRGLGFALARAFSRSGCAVAICARDEEELARAAGRLRSEGASVLAVRCDVTQREQVRQMVREVIGQTGRIDILVNNAGVIQVGPVRQMEVEDFQRAFDVMFWGALHPILEVLPLMTRAADGTIVNITSIGGKVSVPHLIPYGCAKFALVALSEGLHAELASDGVHVLTVVPGLMRTGSHVQAFFKGKVDLEYAWFAASANLPGLAISPESAARRIVKAVRSRRGELVLSLPAKALVRLQGVSPQSMQRFTSLAARLLPSLPKDNGPPRRGSEVAASRDSWLLRLVNRAGERATQEYQWRAGST